MAGTADRAHRPGARPLHAHPPRRVAPAPDGGDVRRRRQPVAALERRLLLHAGRPRRRAVHIMGFRLYPNNDVLDAFALVSTGGRQHNLRWSRRLRPAIDDLSCGPLSVEVIVGLRHLRTRCTPNPYGITFELDWLGTCPPYLEDHLVSYRGGRLVSERSNFDQTCAVTGWIEVDGRRWHVGPDRWTGVRDHSWGVGSVGGPKHPDAAPLEPSPRAGPAPVGDVRHGRPVDLLPAPPERPVRSPASRAG